MSQVLSGLWVGVLLVAPLFVALGTAVIWLHFERKRSRVPIEFKLLRGPGETLRRKIAEMDESFPQNVLIASVLAFVLPVGGLRLGRFVFPNHPAVERLIAAALLVVCTVCLCWLVIRHIRTRRNHLLGYLGERAVGEHLNTLAQAGFRVFHDVPAENRGRKFNVDHVVVGPTGLFSIETKTRRKGRARFGRKDHEVIFDGRQLVWPWGEDRKGLDQAQSEAEWLSNWLRQITGLDVQAKPILALPGWFVTLKARGAVAIMNEKNLVSAISRPGAADSLSSEQVDLIARQLEARCRDVED